MLSFRLQLCLLAVVSLVTLHPTRAAPQNKTSSKDSTLTSTLRPVVVYPEARIVGGNFAREGQFPYQVSVRVYGQTICGGSIISANYILTAAHCVPSNYRPSDLSIRAGSILSYQGGQVVNVAAVIRHPQYRDFNNDIALVRLSKPLQFNNRVKAIALATRTPASGSAVITSGWGRTSTNGETSRILKFNTLRAISQSECARVLGRVPSNVLCLAHTENNGVCNGDSGGPAMYNNQLVGVTNYIVNRCGANNADGFADVALHRDWIRSNSGV